jgi:long-subunit fatty acid transport protein
LGLGVPADFAYDAEVNTRAPQMTTVGLAWQANPKLDLLLQWEWLDWSGAMPNLPIALTTGTNSAINGLLQSTSLNDSVPFEWKDRHIFRLGGE